MPKRPSIAMLLGGMAIILVLSFKTPEVAPAVPAESLPAIVGSQGGSSSPAAPVASGSFAGSAIQTRFGPVQVRVTLQDGRITAVEAIQMPGNDPRSSQISQYAIPQLVEAVLQSQSAQVHSVSGATYTCQAFMQSMRSALAQAGM
jgi:uncharacterized protein with FMN-binding domain